MYMRMCCIRWCACGFLLVSVPKIRNIFRAVHAVKLSENIRVKHTHNMLWSRHSHSQSAEHIRLNPGIPPQHSHARSHVRFHPETRTHTHTVDEIYEYTICYTVVCINRSPRRVPFICASLIWRRRVSYAHATHIAYILVYVRVYA